MGQRSILDSLKQRRVIRTTLLYVALLWVALQVADLLAGADIIPELAVRWLLLAGAVGLPLTMIGSWFFDSPWRTRRWTSIAGDLVILVAITLAAALFAWQQWQTTFTRPTVAVLSLEATDLREDSADLGQHISTRLRSALATRPEIRVVETRSSFNNGLESLSLRDKASRLGADFLITGTIAQLDTLMRLNVQVFDHEGQLVAGTTFEDRVLDQAQLQNRVLAELWPSLPLRDDGLDTVRDVIAACRYPESREAILAIAALDAGDQGHDLAGFAKSHTESGMLQLARAREVFAAMESAPATQRPVMQQVAMQHLASARRLCPALPDNDLLQLAHTRETITDDILHQHPNSAPLYRRASAQNSESGRADAFLAEAKLLDPLSDW